MKTACSSSNFHPVDLAFVNNSGLIITMVLVNDIQTPSDFFYLYVLTLYLKEEVFLLPHSFIHSFISLWIHGFLFNLWIIIHFYHLF